MGEKFEKWHAATKTKPLNLKELTALIKLNRQFDDATDLAYGDYGLRDAIAIIEPAIRENKRIALYADYDVDGTMSCVSWIWFFKAIGFANFVHYIPCRFEEGYGLNMDAMKHLIDDENADVIITMDTGITANEEAAYCLERGVEFICTDHHKVQPEKMPDCVILNPKMHPDEAYQELCGCGITFVLLRQLGQSFQVSKEVWNDILALTGMATICDVVPLNGVNHRLANLGVAAILRSQRPVLKDILKAASVDAKMDEKDVGFRIGPRINAVGRLRHASTVVKAFVEDNPSELVAYMGECNEERKKIQAKIVDEARALASTKTDLKLFLGGDWHQGVVGIAASKISETYWRPTWLFQRGQKLCKGSARSVPGFDVTEAMSSCSHLFEKFGGHKAAGGFSFLPENEDKISAALEEYCKEKYDSNPLVWQSRIDYDCEIPEELTDLGLADALEGLKPFGHGFEEPRFLLQAAISRVQFYNDKATGEPKHTAVTVSTVNGEHKIMFFNEVHDSLQKREKAAFIVSASRNRFRGRESLSLMGHDWH